MQKLILSIIPLLALVAGSGCAARWHYDAGLLKDAPGEAPRETPDGLPATPPRAGKSDTDRAIAKLERAGLLPLTLTVYVAPGERAPAGVEIMALDNLLSETTTTTVEGGMAPLTVRTLSLPLWRARPPGGAWQTIPSPQIVPSLDGMGFVANVFLVPGGPSGLAIPAPPVPAGDAGKE